MNNKKSSPKIMKDFTFCFSIFLLVFASLGLGFLLGTNIDYKIESQIRLEANSSCYNLSLEDTAKCLNNELSSFYFYNLSQIGKKLTDEELKENGGVCTNAAEYYKEKAESLGFYGSLCDMNIYTDLSGVNHWHQIAIISNEDGYVVLDQKSIIGYGYLDVNKSNVKNE